VQLGIKEQAMLLSEFTKAQREFHSKKLRDIKMLWQELLVSNIQENLEGFKFYLTNPADYINQEIQLVITRIDCMFNHYIRSLIV